MITGVNVFLVDPARIDSQHGLNGFESVSNFSKFKKHAQTIRKIVSKSESWTNLDVLLFSHKALHACRTEQYG